jgi:hypothetical protein
VYYTSIEILIQGYKIFIFLAIAVKLFLEKWLNLNPGTRIVEEVSVGV